MNIFNKNSQNNPFASNGKWTEGAQLGGFAVSTAAPALGGLISGGLQSKAGSAVSNIGGTIGSAVGAVNPVLGAAISLGSQFLGGGINKLWGAKVNQANVNAVKNNINSMNSYSSNAGDFDSLANNMLSAPSALSFNQGFLGKQGKFSHKISNMYKDLNVQSQAATQHVINENKNNERNINMNQGLNALATSFALGGQLGYPIGGALDYAMATDSLNQKAFEVQNKISPVVFAYGGTKPKARSHGTDFTNGVTFVNTGGTHEQNPFGGVKMGVDPQGVPNQVEKGEVIYNDFVFSNRIQVPNEVKEALGLRGKDITFAKAAKQIQKESEERPNDPISRRGLDAAMGALAQAQEQYKQQQMAMQQQAQQMVNQQMAQEQQLQQAQQMQQAAPMEALMGALGGQLAANQYPLGGPFMSLFGQLPVYQPLSTASSGFVQAVKPKLSPAFGDMRFNTGNLLLESQGVNKQWRPMFTVDNNPSEGVAKAKAKRERSFTPNTYGESEVVTPQIETIGDYSDIPVGSTIGSTITNPEVQTNVPQSMPPGVNPFLLNQAYKDAWVSEPWQNYGTPTYGEALDSMGIDTNQFLYDSTNSFPQSLVLPYAIGSTGVLDTPVDYDAYMGSDSEINRLNSRINASSPVNTPTVGQAYRKGDFNPLTAIISGDGKEYKDTWLTGLRYAPVVGSAINVLGDLMGWTNKADYSNADSILEAANANLRDIAAQQLGDYIGPKRFDRLFYQNELNKQLGTGMRGVQNTSAANVGAANAAQIAMVNNAQNQVGTLGRQAEEFNREDEFKEKEFNKDTNKTNATLALEAAAANNQAASTKVSAAAQAAAIRDAIDQRIGAARTLNLTNLFNNIGNVGIDALNRRDRDFLLWAGVYGGLPDWWVPYGMSQENWRNMIDRQKAGITSRYNQVSK